LSESGEPSVPARKPSLRAGGSETDVTGAVSLSTPVVFAIVGVLAMAAAAAEMSAARAGQRASVCGNNPRRGQGAGCGYLGCAMSERLLGCGGRRPGTPHGELDPAADGDKELVLGGRLVTARMELQ